MLVSNTTTTTTTTTTTSSSSFSSSSSATNKASTVTIAAAAVPLAHLPDIPYVPIDEAFALLASYSADSDPAKVSLGIGVYRDDNGQPWVLPSVRAAERRLLDEDNSQIHEYLPGDGYAPFVNAARDLMFGELDTASKSRIASVQTVAGTQANYLGATFLTAWLRPASVWLPAPTWPNHYSIWANVGNSSDSGIVTAPKQRSYPYIDPKTHMLDLEGMLEMLSRAAQPGDVVVLHACAHNPTGVDPSREQWEAIAELFAQRGLFAFFDCAYQGFASGDPAADAWAVRHFFAERGLPLAVAQSCSKTFGLYGQRVGALHVATASSEQSEAVVSQLVRLQRAELSNCPAYGARVVATVLESQDLKAAWMRDLGVMSERIQRMRKILYEELLRLETPGDWRHVVEQVSWGSSFSNETSLQPFCSFLIYLWL